MPVNLPFHQKHRCKSAAVVALTGLSSDAAAVAFCQTSARKKKEKKKTTRRRGGGGGARRRETKKRNDSLVSGWEHGRVRHVGADGTNKKKLVRNGQKNDKRKRKERERGEQSDKREPGSWTSAVVISGDL